MIFQMSVKIDQKVGLDWHSTAKDSMDYLFLGDFVAGSWKRLINVVSMVNVNAWNDRNESVDDHISTAVSKFFVGNCSLTWTKDRGAFSLETVCLLFSLKVGVFFQWFLRSTSICDLRSALSQVKYPNQIHLIRGNHEARHARNPRRCRRLWHNVEHVWNMWVSWWHSPRGSNN